MHFYTQEELESVDTLNKVDIEQCFMRLNKLIIHNRDNEARDYCNQLMIVVSRSFDRVIKPSPIRNVIDVESIELPEDYDYEIPPEQLKEPVVTVQKVVTPEPEQVKPSAFFAWSAHQETCYFCRKIIPARVTGHGVFMNQDYSRKWCESCATEEHKKHPNYLKYKK